MDASFIHGTLIAFQGAGCLLLGHSGAGKSRLAMEAILHGARLIADDQVTLTITSGMLMGGPVRGLQGVIELRGVGLVRFPDTPAQHIIHHAIELTPLAQIERLPSARETTQLAGREVPLWRLPPPPQSNGSILLMLLKSVHEGRILPPDWHPTA